MNTKKFKKGQVVYFVRQHRSSYEKYVWYGTVADIFSGEVDVTLYHHKENRLIDGVPYNDVPNVSKWHKLPKGWSYDTVLFELDYEPYDKDAFKGYITKPKDIKLAIEKGYLVPMSEIDQTDIYTEIDKNHGWRLIKQARDWTRYEPSSLTIEKFNLYTTYKEAQAVIDAEVAEFERQAALSDYEWSLEQIDKNLNKAVKFGYITETKRDEFKQRLINTGEIEDIETRVFSGHIQYKKWKNKKWLTME